MNPQEQVLIVYSVNQTPRELIEEATDAVSSYVRSACDVQSVKVRPLQFEIPTACAPGASLGTELAKQLESSIGGIVFVDDLRPNVAYELGFLHGKGVPVLLVSTRPLDDLWLRISDLAGCAVLRGERGKLTTGVYAYLDRLYDKVARIPRYPSAELPTASRNMVEKLSECAQIPVELHDGDFGKAMCVDTWGGVVFDADLCLLPGAKFSLALRAQSTSCDYSIYFRVKYCDSAGLTRTVALGLTSLRDKVGFEGNERNLPSQPLTKNWRLLTGSFETLLRAGQILDFGRVTFLERIRVRAGNYFPQPCPKVPPYEIGFLEITGIDR